MNPRKSLADHWYSAARIEQEKATDQVDAHIVMAARLLPLEAREIADLGCGTGAFGRLLRQKRQLRPIGVEFCPAAAEAARPYYTAIHDLDLETDALPFAPQSLDAVLALDLLDDLADPAALLARIRPLLKPAGVLIGSVRNARSAALVKQLLVDGRHWTDPSLGHDRALPAFCLRDLADLLARNGFWFERPLIATHRGLDDEIVPLVHSLTALGLNDEQLRGELATEAYIFLAAPVARPSGRLMVTHIPAISVTWEQALIEIE